MAQVMATQGHRWEDGDPDTALFLDLDLSVLGQPWPRYQAYLQSVREEYRWVPEDLYAQRRVQVLQTFLQRPRLYFTDALSARYESEARANLAREIGQLQAIRAG
jgi:predicted metal-dependent HD superfamily phosphohydrolase